MSLAGGPGKQHEQVQSSLGRVNNLLYMQFIPLLWLWKALKIEVQWILKKKTGVYQTQNMTLALLSQIRSSLDVLT